MMSALAVLAFAVSGFSRWLVVLIAVVVAGPAVFFYGVITLTRSRRLFSPETVDTHGMPLDMLAPVYDRYCPAIGLGKAFRSETIRHAGLKAGESVLDVGCGTGVLTRLAASAVGPAGEVTGIDPSAKMIEIAMENARKGGSRVLFRLGVTEDLRFEDNRFDCVLSSAMLHHLPPDLKRAGLSEAFRVLKPGGRLVLVDIDRPVNPLWWIVFWPMLFWPFTRDQIKGRLGELMRRAGFTNVEKVGAWGGFLGFWKAFKSVF